MSEEKLNLPVILIARGVLKKHKKTALDIANFLSTGPVDLLDTKSNEVTVKENHIIILFGYHEQVEEQIIFKPNYKNYVLRLHDLKELIPIEENEHARSIDFSKLVSFKEKLLLLLANKEQINYISEPTQSEVTINLDNLPKGIHQIDSPSTLWMFTTKDNKKIAVTVKELNEEEKKHIKESYNLHLTIEEVLMIRTLVEYLGATDISIGEITQANNSSISYKSNS